MATAETEVKDERSPEEKAATSHLDGVELQPTPDEILAEEAVIDTGDLKLPKDLKKALELQLEVQNSIPNDATEGKVKRAKLEKIAAHIHEISQGPKQPPLHSPTIDRLAAAQSGHAKSFRLEMLAREHAEVRQLLDERNDLQKQIEKLTKK
jgi:hypothetical protein